MCRVLGVEPQLMELAASVQCEASKRTSECGDTGDSLVNPPSNKQCLESDFDAHLRTSTGHAVISGPGEQVFVPLPLLVVQYQPNFHLHSKIATIL